MPRKTQEQFIIDAKAKHGEKYDYLNVIYETSKSKIKIICGMLLFYIIQLSISIFRQ